jgi:tRNA 2-thiouridine synthesizing protein C
LSAYLLIISTKAPYHTSASVDALEAALAASNVGIDTRILFQSDGVYQLLSSQAPEQIAHKNVFKKLSALPLYDIEHIYVDQHSLDERGLHLSASSIPWLALESHDTIKLIKNANNVLVF